MPDLRVNTPRREVIDPDARIEFEIDEAELIEKVFGRPMDEITDVIVKRNKAACLAGDCSLKATCEKITDEMRNVLPQIAGMPMDEEAWSGSIVKISCNPSMCEEPERAGNTAREIVKLDLTALEAQRQVDSSLNGAREEATRIRSEASSAAADVMAAATARLPEVEEQIYGALRQDLFNAAEQVQ